MAVYPFYINTDAEGRRTPIAGGTRKKDGEMTTTVYQRETKEQLQLHLRLGSIPQKT